MATRDSKPGRAAPELPGRGPEAGRIAIDLPDDDRVETVNAPTTGHEPSMHLGLPCGGISFLRGGGDDESELTDEPVWRRYVDDRLRHFTISHR